MLKPEPMGSGIMSVDEPTLRYSNSLAAGARNCLMKATDH